MCQHSLLFTFTGDKVLPQVLKPSLEEISGENFLSETVALYHLKSLRTSEERAAAVDSFKRVYRKGSKLESI